MVPCTPYNSDGTICRYVYCAVVQYLFQYFLCSPRKGKGYWPFSWFCRWSLVFSYASVLQCVYLIAAGVSLKWLLTTSPGKKTYLVDVSTSSSPPQGGCVTLDINVLRIISIRAAGCDISNLVFITCNGHISDVDHPMEFALWPTSKSNHIVDAY